MYTEVNELVDAVLNAAGDELVKGVRAQESVVVQEVSRWLYEMGWLTPTEVDVMRLHVDDAAQGLDSVEGLLEGLPGMESAEGALAGAQLSLGCASCFANRGATGVRE